MIAGTKKLRLKSNVAREIAAIPKTGVRPVMFRRRLLIHRDQPSLSYRVQTDERHIVAAAMRTDDAPSPSIEMEFRSLTAYARLALLLGVFVIATAVNQSAAGQCTGCP